MSRGARRRLSVVCGASLAALAVQASAADARTATIWACHGPEGTPLGVAGLAPATTGDGKTSLESDGCTATGTAVAGATASFSRPDPIGGSTAGWRIDVPAAATLRHVRMARSTRAARGPVAAGVAQQYQLRTQSGVLESASLFESGSDLMGVFAAPADGAFVSVEASCDRTPDQRCSAASAGSVSVGSLAVEVEDSEAPRGTVAGVQSPVGGTLQLAVTASDGGVGLATATATIDGRPATQLRLGTETCTDLSGLDPALDLPAGGACPATVSSVALPIDLTAFALGPHQLQVRIADAAGNEALILDQLITVVPPPPPFTPSVTLEIGNGGDTADGANGRADTKLVPPCLSPRLSMALDQRPLRTTKAGIPVLRKGRRYRFRGRLTCRINEGRRTAPRGIPVTLVSRLGPGGRSVVSKTGVVTRRSGRLTLIMSYRGSRSMSFEYHSLDGSSTRVRIAIVVARTATSKASEPAKAATS